MVGTLLGAIAMGVLAGIGTKLGVAQQVQGRGPMGYYANFVPICLLTVISAVGWTAVNTVFAVIALQMLVAIPFWIAATAIFAVQAAFAIWGHNLVHLINKIATVVLAILFAIITFLSLRHVNLEVGVNPDAPLYVGQLAGWITFAGFFFAYIVTWTPFASDFSRYLPSAASHTQVAAYTAGGTFLSMVWLGGIGVLVSSFAGQLGAIEALDQLTGSWAPVAMATIVVSTLPVSAMNLYGGSLSVLTIRIPVNRVVGVILVAALGLAVTLWMHGDPYGRFYSFLVILSYLVVPFSTILLLDYYLRMRPRLKMGVVEQLYDTSRQIQWGFVAWIIACVFSSLFWQSALWSGPFAAHFAQWGDVSYFAGALAGGVGYMVLRTLPDLSLIMNRRSRGGLES